MRVRSMLYWYWLCEARWIQLMIKIAIVDDEEQTREQILRTLKENIQEQHEVEIKLYASGESFFEEIQKGETADILFTDIQMQQLDGVELGKLVRRICPDMYIVFITSYEEYAAESYRIEAYQYILDNVSLFW